MNQDESSKTTAERPRTRDIFAHLQDRIAAAFGILPADREAVVRAMLDKSGRAPAGYWLQLLLAMGIASLGLVLGSTAVVIGAMLISPLMSPIVELGMGLAIPLERDELEQHAQGRIRRVVLALQVFFGRRYGRLFRVVMPEPRSTVASMLARR